MGTGWSSCCSSQRRMAAERVQRRNALAAGVPTQHMVSATAVVSAEPVQTRSKVDVVIPTQDVVSAKAAVSAKPKQGRNKVDGIVSKEDVVLALAMIAAEPVERRGAAVVSVPTQDVVTAEAKASDEWTTGGFFYCFDDVGHLNRMTYWCPCVTYGRNHADQLVTCTCRWYQDRCRLRLVPCTQQDKYKLMEYPIGLP